MVSGSDLRALLQSEHVTPVTRTVLMERMESPPRSAPRFFDDGAFETLRAVCARLIPRAERPSPDEIAKCIDDRLADGKGNGWRYDILPPDGEAYIAGLGELNAAARTRFEGSFVTVTGEQQDALLREVQKANPPGARFFEDLLAEAVEAYYSHPAAQWAIGYSGFADALGWKKIGLNQHEAWEVSDRPGQAAEDSPRLVQVQADIRPVGRVYPTTETVDAVVIGTGAGGAPLLARLAQAGLKVVALEAGPWWNPAADFATDERAQAKLFWTDERLSAGEDPVGFGNNNSGVGVGGSTLHFTAYTPRPQPDDFLLRTEFGLGEDWPIGYQDLEPYFDELEVFLGISGPETYPWGPKRKGSYPLAPLPLNGAAQIMAEACAKAGIQTSPAPNAALSARYYQTGVGWRPACTNRGFCQAGCSVGAKASTDVTFIPLALAHGAELRPECYVTAIETDARGRVNGVVYTRAGKNERQSCRTVFLCAGAIETPRILLMNELGNASGQVGRNFIAHTGMQVWGQFDAEVFPWKGIPGSLISEDTHRPQGASFAGGYLLQSIGVMPVTYASQLARGEGLWGKALDEHMRGYNHVAGINILGDCLPSASNFLELSEEKDGRGVPKPRIHFTAGENERQMMTHAKDLMCDLWRGAGAEKLWSLPRYAHTIGTCRIGSDPATSVVDSDGRCYDVPGLIICDNSVFPSALAANPALTIMAISLRTADRFLRRHAQGEGDPG